MSTIPAPLPKPDRVCVSGVKSCGFTEDQTFECWGCQKEVCWCYGSSGADEDHDHCIDCQVENQHAEKPKA